MSTRKLNPFAEKCADALFTQMPQWRQYLVSAPSTDRPHSPNDDDLVIEIPSPLRSDGEALFFHTDSDFDYVIVGFGPGWAEFADWHGDCGIEGIVKQAIQCANGIMEENLMGIHYRRGWGLFSPEQVAQCSDVYRITSWRGTYDKSASDSGER
jgi:hypothetical protein